MSEWRDTTLGEFVALQRGHDLTEQKAIAAVLGALAGVEALVPPTDVVDSFESVGAPLLGRMRCNLFQTRTIAALRDTLLPKLLKQDMHLDPDFDHLTYGDQGERAKQMRSKLGPGDLVVFYAGMRDVHPAAQLVYPLIGCIMMQHCWLRSR